MWLAFLANTALVTAPLVLAHNPVKTLKETANEARDVRTGRGKLFLILSAFFFVEGLGILAHPTLAQRVSHPPVQTGSRYLFPQDWTYYSQQQSSRWILICASCHQPEAKEVALAQTGHDTLVGSTCRRECALMLHLTGSQGLSGPAVDMRDPLIALLFSLVAASAHIIVPAAVFNLKVRTTC